MDIKANPKSPPLIRWRHEPPLLLRMCCRLQRIHRCQDCIPSTLCFRDFFGGSTHATPSQTNRRAFLESPLRYRLRRWANRMSSPRKRRGGSWRSMVWMMKRTKTTKRPWAPMNCLPSSVPHSRSSQRSSRSTSTSSTFSGEPCPDRGSLDLGRGATRFPISFAQTHSSAARARFALEDGARGRPSGWHRDFAREASRCPRLLI